MGRIILRGIVVIILAIITNNFASEVSDAFEREGLLSKRMPKAPEGLATVQYSTIEADLGNALTADAVSVPPNVTFDHSPDQYYTIMMVEPDPPVEVEFVSDFQFWLVVNVPGNNMTAGETLSEYFKPGPEPFSGVHHYVFVVYLQPGKLDFDEPHIPSGAATALLRIFFSPQKFSEKYNLELLAGNFYVIYSLEPKLY